MKEEGKKTFLKFVMALLACSLLLLVLSIPAVSADIDLEPTEIKPYHYYKEGKGGGYFGDPWFNLVNGVQVQVHNYGSDEIVAYSFTVTLYANDMLIEEKVFDLPLGANNANKIRFELWKPVGGANPLTWTDTAQGALGIYTDTSKNYTLKVVVDEANEVAESDETNNNKSMSQKVVWNGYMADHPLENYKHGTVKGGIIYTTGDGTYTGMGLNKYGIYNKVNYNLQIPSTVKHARLYFYYTWAKLGEKIGDPTYKCPKIGITLKTPSGDVHELSMDKSYNDHKGDQGSWRMPWGTYTYDLTGYVSESGTYVVNYTNLNHEQGEAGHDANFAGVYANAPPAILVVYENATMPEREYWINEGADVIIGGRRGDGGFLALEECLNNATFGGSIDLSRVKNATIGVVSAWGDDVPDDVLYFNNKELGRGVYCGYGDSCTQELNGISMTIGSGAQVGINVIDVKSHLVASNSRVTQGDDGDNMMPANAFLVVEYKQLPDLNITDKSEEWVSLGDKTYDITYTVKNIGDKEAGASMSSIKMDGTEKATDAVPELAPGASHTATFGPFTMTGDSDTIRVCADKDNAAVSESDETNNCMENVFKAPPPSTTKTIPAGENGTAEGPPGSDTTVNVTASASGDVNVTVAYYSDNPHPGATKPDNMVSKYIDISVDNADNVSWPMYVEMHYTNGEIAGMDESTLGLYHYKAGAWHRCSDTGVNIDENYVWANVEKNECSGSPFASGGSSPPVPVPEYNLAGLIALIALVTIALALATKAKMKNKNRKK
jgi:hypothetical protein